MSAHHETWLRRSLGLLAAVCGVGVLVMIVLGAALGTMAGLVLQLLLTMAALAIGAALMQVQLHARDRYAAGTRPSITLSVGVAMIFVSQVCFLLLVWSDQWKSWQVVWRLWWISMVPSVFITHVIVLRGLAAGHRGIVERLTAACAIWAGGMILWLGFRPNMLDGVSPLYLWIGAVPAAGTTLGTLYLTIRWVLGRTPVGVLSRRTIVAMILVTNFVVALTGFWVGRATSHHAGPSGGPEDVGRALRDDFREELVREQYATQVVVATYMGDTRITGRQPFISQAQIEAVAPRLQPGDIILERRNWFLSNMCLPGFWPHAALYVGGVEDLKSLGIADHPSVRARLEEFSAPDEQGHPHAIIEAMSEGVVFTSLEHSLHADYIAVLRPRLTREQVAGAIVRAFENVGRPYDFNFDFEDRTKLVCTQLVCVSYEGLLNFELKRVMGRWTLPANEIARTYVAQPAGEGRQLDFVLFLDGDVTTGTAREQGEAAFCKSADRPRVLVER